MVIYYLLKGDEFGAERAMQSLIRWSADLSGGDYYYPLGAKALAEVLDSGPASLKHVVFSAPNVPKLGYCSDLYAYYVEWLDMRSRVAVALKQTALIVRSLADARQLRTAVPRELLGTRYDRALAAIIRRLGSSSSRQLPSA